MKNVVESINVILDKQKKESVKADNLKYQSKEKKERKNEKELWKLMLSV